MDEMNKYTEPRLVKGKKPIKIPKGSTLEKEWAKNSWYVNYSFNGKQYRIKGNINRIKDHKEKAHQAEVLLQSIKSDLKNGYNPENPNAFYAQAAQENIILPDAVKIYIDQMKTYSRDKTVSCYDSKLLHLIDAFPKKQVNSFTSKDIEKYIYDKIHSKKPGIIFIKGKSYKLKKAKPWTANTVRTAKGYFHTFFEWCKTNNYLKGDNPVSKVEAKRIRSEVATKDSNVPFTKEDIDSIMTYLDKHDRLTAFFCRFINSTCLRPGEISKLRIKDVDLVKKQISIPLDITKNTKKNTIEKIEIEDNFLAILNKLNLSEYPKDFFLISNSETIVGEKSISGNKAYKRLKKVLKILGLDEKGYTLYSFKHFSNIQRYLNGWSLVEIMKSNRHSSITMTEKYLRGIISFADTSKKTVPPI